MKEDEQNMNVTWYGTASIGIDDGKTRLLFDPFLRLNRRLDNTPMETFLGADAVLVTHGHVDHIMNIPELMRKDRNVELFCTKTPAATLNKRGVAKDRMHIIAPGDSFSIGDFNIKVYQGKHVDFDKGYVRSVFGRCTVMFPKTFKMEYYNLQMPENGEIVVYEVENAGKTVLLMGSYGTDSNVDYPVNPDMFILPYGGSSQIDELSAPFIEKLRPKKIMVDHFDDAFPPLTKRMNVEKFGKDVTSVYPEMDFIIPKERISFAV